VGEEEAMSLIRLRNQRGQTGIAVLALLVALVALGVSVYTYVQVGQRGDLAAQITTLQELGEQGRKEIADALKRLEEKMRGNQPPESPPRP
jgi:uncharacterized protein HemX